MKNYVEIRIRIDNENVLNSVYKTMRVEIKTAKTERGEAKIIKENDILILEIIGSDFVSIRALTNSSMRLIKMSMEIAEMI